jgi:predicted XRE-type DNA-binding protein
MPDVELIKSRLRVAETDAKARKETMMATKVSRSSGNVFGDLGLKKPEELLAKTKLAARIVQLLEDQKLNQTQAARRLGIDQPKVSQIYRGRLDDFSLERLMRFLTALNQDVRIVVEDKPRRGRWSPDHRSRVRRCVSFG